MSKHKKILMVLTLTFLAAGFSINLNAKSTMGNIVGGLESSIAKHPYVVSMQGGDLGLCGGTLISDKYVLTAGHCLQEIDFKSLQINIGMQTLRGTNPGAEKHSAKRIIFHPLFVADRIQITHDYALIELTEKSKQKPIELIKSDTDPTDVALDHNALALGWGRLGEDEGASETLREVTLPLAAANDCAKAYPSQIDDSMFCAGGGTTGKDTCQGDSGGPLVVKNSRGEEILAGVVSWGQGCARPNTYGVYSDVSFVRKWIDSIILN